MKKVASEVAPNEDFEEEPRRSKKTLKASDDELGKLYDETSSRILQERNDFFLPQIRDYVQQKKWVNLRPEYQRRHRWDEKKQSRLIESLLMNVPVPPVFLFEHELNRYEVMDGQQRLVSLIDFYSGKLKLKGLEAWHHLNGRKYEGLPNKLKRGLDRRRISAVILLAESKTPENLGFPDIRREIFERLNTGGTSLNYQELRNCIYSGPFNDLIVDLAKERLFRKMWDIPITNVESETLRKNKLFQTMADCQIVLRFFAFSDAQHISGSVKRMLDKCMERSESIGNQEVRLLKEKFRSRLKLAHTIFGADAFKLGDEGERKQSRPLYDAIMVALDRLWERRKLLRKRRIKVRARLGRLLRSRLHYAILVGRPNTAAAVKRRINLVEQTFRKAI